MVTPMAQYYEDHIYFTSRNPVPKRVLYVMFLPFTNEVWAATVAILVFVTFSLSTLAYIEQVIIGKRYEIKSFWTLGRSFLNNIGVLLAESTVSTEMAPNSVQSIRQQLV